jgi:hypothetical protein
MKMPPVYIFIYVLLFCFSSVSAVLRLHPQYIKEASAALKVPNKILYFKVFCKSDKQAEF